MIKQNEENRESREQREIIEDQNNNVVDAANKPETAACTVVESDVEERLRVRNQLGNMRPGKQQAGKRTKTHKHSKEHP